MPAARRLLRVSQISTVDVFSAAWGHHHDHAGHAGNGWRGVQIRHHEVQDKDGVHWGADSVKATPGKALHTGLMARAVEGHAGIRRARQDAACLHVLRICSARSEMRLWHMHSVPCSRTCLAWQSTKRHNKLELSAPWFHLQRPKHEHLQVKDSGGLHVIRCGKTSR